MLNEGGLAEEGTHEQLLEKQGLYSAAVQHSAAEHGLERIKHSAEGWAANELPFFRKSAQTRGTYYAGAKR